MAPQKSRKNVPQCTHFCTADDSLLLTAVLGSCVAMCVYDEMVKVGGMNHILLPGQGSLSEVDGLYGANLVELLLNELYQNGARRGHLKFKLFGGAKLLKTGMNVGEKNVEFVLGLLATEGMNIVSSSLGGACSAD